MLFPIGDDNPSERVPYVTYGIVAVNALVFLVVNQFGQIPNRVAFEWGFLPAHPHWYTFFTSMFLHADLLHIVGNLWFLWIVGDNVEDKLGHAVYLGFYLLSGAVAVGFYMLFTEFGAGRTPLIGASGAIAGVLGCYMLLFPNARIRIFYWVFFFFLGVMAVRAKWVIGAWLVLQLIDWFATSNQYMGGVAYAAHVGGFLVGIGVALMVRGRLVRAGRLDLRDPVAPSRGRTGRSVGPTGTEARTAPRPWPTPVFENPRHLKERDGTDFFGTEEAIADNVKSGLLDVAVERYREYVRMPHAKPLPAWAQIEIAAELFRRKDYEGAMEAYRRYVGHHATGPDAAEAKFRLGVILSRHRREYFRAREYLVQAAMEHPDPQIAAFAREELARIEPFL